MSPAVAYLQKYRFYILRDEFILSVGVVSVDFINPDLENVCVSGTETITFS